MPSSATAGAPEPSVASVAVAPKTLPGVAGSPAPRHRRPRPPRSCRSRPSQRRRAPHCRPTRGSPARSTARRRHRTRPGQQRWRRPRRRHGHSSSRHVPGNAPGPAQLRRGRHRKPRLAYPCPLDDPSSLRHQHTDRAVARRHRGGDRQAWPTERYILGPEVAAFEQEFADYCGAANAIGVANGTEALTIALRALGVGPGDEVVVPAFTFYASAEAIPPTGARPVFCDVDPETACVTPETVKAATDAAYQGRDRGASVRQRRPSRRDRGARRAGDRGLRTGRGHAVSERPPGALGTIATFSFFPSKNLGGFGDGGAITTHDAAIAERVRMLRFHGSRDKVTSSTSATTAASTSCRPRSCA